MPRNSHNGYFPAARPNYDGASFFLLLFSLVCLAVVAAPPVALAAGNPFAAALIYVIFSPVCHQLPERAFHILGQPLALCARCTGLILGTMTGAAMILMSRARSRPAVSGRNWLACALLLMLADFAAPLAGWYENTLFTRFSTGLVAAHLAAPYVAIGWAELRAILINEGWLVFPPGSGTRGGLPA